jgi:hypothetical protein
MWRTTIFKISDFLGLGTIEDEKIRFVNKNDKIKW